VPPALLILVTIDLVFVGALCYARSSEKGKIVTKIYACCDCCTEDCPEWMDHLTPCVHCQEWFDYTEEK